MATSKPFYCWDSCVVIAWIGEEATAPLADMELVVREIDAGAATLLLSVMTYTELLDAKQTAAQAAKLRSFLDRSNVVPADITRRIAEKAAEFRSRALGCKPSRKIKAPDATIMATASLYKATVFHTLEPTLVNLSGGPVVDELIITPPRPWSGARSFFNSSGGKV